jgi:cell division protease FtsH
MQRSSGGAFTGVGFKRQAAFSGIAASLIILQSIIVGTPALAQKEDSNPLTYGELLEKIDAGEVSKIELDQAQQTAQVQLKGEKADEPLQEVILLDQNPELIEKIRNKQVDLEVRSSAEGRAAAGLLANLLWILPLMFLMVLFLRRSANTSNQALNFW